MGSVIPSFVFVLLLATFGWVPTVVADRCATALSARDVLARSYELGPRLDAQIENKRRDLTNLRTGDSVLIPTRLVYETFPALGGPDVDLEQMTWFRPFEFTGYRKWRGKDCLGLRRRPYGDVTLPIEDLKKWGVRHAYVQESEEALFRRGDFVEFENDGEDLDRIGVFLGAWGFGQYMIRYLEVEGGMRWERVRRFDQVHPLAFGNRKRFEKALEPFWSIVPSFEPGEIARARLSSGQITLVKVLSRLDSEEYEILFQGRVRRVHFLSLAKYTGDRPVYTPNGGIVGWTDLGAQGYSPDSPVGLFLEAGQRFTSHPDYVAASFRERLELLVEFVWRFVGPHFSGNIAPDLNSLLCAGSGVCRHKAHLIYTLLVENGILAYLEETEEHAWASAYQPISRGAGFEKFTVDPSSWEPVLSWWEVEQRISKQRKGFSARHHGNAERTVHWSVHQDHWEAN